MEPSLRIVPAIGPKSASLRDTAGSLGLHDDLQYGHRSLANEIRTDDGFQQRIENWQETQDNLKLTIQRNIYGMHAPIRQLMERKIVSLNSPLTAMPQSNLRLDILMGRDEIIEPADVFGGMEVSRTDIRREMEKKLRM